MALSYLPHLKIIDPLEQFDFVPLLTLFNMTLLNNLIIFVLLILIGLSALLLTAIFGIVALSNLGFFNSKLFSFVKTIVKENISLSGQKHFLIIYYTFLFLLFCNMIGMVPYSFTLSSSFTVTFFLSLGFFIGINIIGCLLHGSDILKLFLPGGAPMVIMPALVLIEILSYFARIFSLSIRLFANMMSGHTLLKILAGFS
jgi:ATP synthase subunit 6